MYSYINNNVYAVQRHGAQSALALISKDSTSSGSPSVAQHRTRYYHEAREGLYRGPLFITTYNLFSLPVSYINVMAASAIVFL